MRNTAYFKASRRTIPEELSRRAQWVLWRLEQRTGGPTKVPYMVHDPERKASSTDSMTWASFDEAVDALEDGHGDGIGFVFSSGDPYAGVDLDGCHNPETGELEPWAAEIVDDLGGYTEASPSGTGLHIIVKGKAPNKKRGPVEAYSFGRFFTMTGDVLGESPARIPDAQDAIDALARKYLQTEEHAHTANGQGPGNDLSDEEVIRRAGRAENGERFLKLWRGDTSGYRSHSEADLALCGHLAFWTGGDASRIDSLFRNSGLMRQKWNRPDYRARTISEALEGRTDFHTPNANEAVDGVDADSEEVPDGADLLDRMAEFMQRYVVLSDEQAHVLALWVVHTHALDAFDTTPYLEITSAEKRSGKTRLLEVLNTIAARPWFTGRVTAAVLVRKVAAQSPTLLLDESDAAFKGDKEYAETLRGVLNSEYRRGGTTSICVGQGANLSYADFSVFGPKAIAGLGNLPDTIADRAVKIELKRRARSESVERFRLRKVRPDAEPLHNAAAAWAAANLKKLETYEPELPDELDDRAQEICEPLLAVAEVAGSNWPERARKALISLAGAAVREDTDSLGVRLLRDIRTVFEGTREDRLPTGKLLAALAEMEEAPWGALRGEALNARGLARLLKPYGIKPEKQRSGESTFRGYRRTDFEDAWARYVPTTLEEAEHPEHVEHPTYRADSGVPHKLRVPEHADYPEHGEPHKQADVPRVPDNRDTGKHGDGESLLDDLPI